MELGIGHPDFSQSSLVSSIVLPSSVLGLLVLAGRLTVVVSDNSANRSLRSVWASECELISGQDGGLLTDDTERNSSIVMISKFSVLLFKRKTRLRIEIATAETAFITNSQLYSIMLLNRSFTFSLP